MLQLPFGTGVYVTGNPELAVAVKVSEVPTTCAGIWLKVMVCACGVLPEPVTVKLSVMELVSVPEVPVSVIVDVPVAAVEVAVRVATIVPAVLPAAKDAVTPLGRPLAVSVTLPVKPPIPPTVMVSVVDEPGPSVTLVADAVRLKPAVFTP